MMDERTGLEGQERGRRFSAERPSIRSATPLQRPVYRANSGPHSNIQSEAKVVDDVISKSPEKPKRTVSKTKPALPRLHKSLVLKRHIAERADHHRKQAKRQHKRHFMSFMVGLVIIAALAVISWAFWDFLPVVKSISIPFISSNNQAKKPDTTVVKPASTLDESKPSAGEVEVYQAAADAPRILRIPKLDIEARVKRVGSSLAGEPISPSNIYDAGWYDESSKPGQAGAILINGHISGSTKNGVFHDLGDLAAGDEIQIERGDHVTVMYIVNKVQTYGGEQIDMDTVLQSIQPDKNGLNLLTSTANYGGVINKSEKRVIVFATQK